MLRLTNQDKASAEGLDRMESLGRLDNLQRAILNRLTDNDSGLTARELFNKINVHEIHSLRPRLTELKDKGYVETVGRRRDNTTGIRISIWKIR